MSHHFVADEWELMWQQEDGWGTRWSLHADIRDPVYGTRHPPTWGIHWNGEFKSGWRGIPLNWYVL